MGQKVHPLGLRLGITQKHRSTWCSDFKNKYSDIVLEDNIIRSFIFKNYPKSKIINILIKRKFNPKKVQKDDNYISIIIHTRLSSKQFLIWNMNKSSKKKVNLDSKLTTKSDNKQITLNSKRFSKSKSKFKRKKKVKSTLITKKQLINLKKNLIIKLEKARLQNFNSQYSTLNPPKINSLIIKKVPGAYSSSKAELLAGSLIKLLEKRILFKRALKRILKKKVKINKFFSKYFDVYLQDSYIKGIKIQISGRLNGAEIARTEWVREGRVPLHTLCANIDYSYKTAKTIYGILGIKIWLFKGEKRQFKITN